MVRDKNVGEINLPIITNPTRPKSRRALGLDQPEGQLCLFVDHARSPNRNLPIATRAGYFEVRLPSAFKLNSRA